MLDIKAPRFKKAENQPEIKKYKIRVFNANFGVKKSTWKLSFQVRKAKAILGRAMNIGAVLALVFLIWAQGGGWQAIDRFLQIFPAYAQTTMYSQGDYKWYANNDAVQPTDAWPAGAANLGENDPIAQDTVRNLEAKLPGSWLRGSAGSRSQFSALAYDSANKTVYVLNEYGGQFGKYDTRFDIFTDLTAKFSSIFTTSGTVGKSLIFVGNAVYIGGNTGQFYRYNTTSYSGGGTYPNPDTAYNLTSKISSFWSNQSVLSLAFDSTNSVIYLVGSYAKFAKYVPATDTATDLTAKFSWSTNSTYALTFDSANTVVYLGGGSGKFGKYVPASDAATDLTSTISSFWSTSSVAALTYDSTNSVIYLGGPGPGVGLRFAKYTPSTGLATDLASTVSSFIGGVTSLTFDPVNSVVYLGGLSSYSRGKLVKYTPATGTATDLSSYVAATNHPNNSRLLAMVFDGTDMWLGGDGGFFVKYNIGSSWLGSGEDLSSLISSFWGGAGISATAYDSGRRDIYIGGGNGKFARYSPVSGLDCNPINPICSPSSPVADLTSILGLPVSSSSDITSISYNSANGIIYLSTFGGQLLKYDPETNSAASLYSSGGTIIRAIGTDTTTYIYAFGEDGLFVRHTISTATNTVYTPTVTNDNPPPTSYTWVNYWSGDDIFAVASGTGSGYSFVLGGGGGANIFLVANTSGAADRTEADGYGSGSSTITSLSYNSGDSKVYQGGVGGEFASVNIASCTGSPVACPSTNLNSQVSFIGGTTINAQVVSSEKYVYLGGSSGQFGRYDYATNTGTDLTSAISSFWSGNTIQSLTLDSTNNVVYIGGGSGKFARYPGASSGGPIISYTDKLPGYWYNPSGYSTGIGAIAKDTANNKIYLTGPYGGFAVYDPSTDALADLSSRVNFLFGTTININAIVFDPINNIVYFGGGVSPGKFAKYNPATGLVTDLSSTISALWGNASINALTYDSTNSVIYLGGSGGKFGKYTPATGTASDLTSLISSFFSGNTINAVIFNSTDATIYLGGYLGKFIKYIPASNTIVDLSAKIPFAASSIYIYALVYDSVNNVIYIGGGSGKFAKYTPATDIGTDLTYKISSYFSSNAIYALAFDSANKVIYLAGASSYGSGTGARAAKYNINSKTAYNLTSQLNFLNGNDDTIRTLFYDSQNKTVYYGGEEWGVSYSLRFGKIYTTQSLPQSGDVLRLRMNARVGDTALGATSQAFKLQYGALSTSCSAVSSWTDVGGIGSGTIWRGYNNGSPSDGATVTSTLLYQSDVAGTYEEENNSAVNPNGVPLLNDIEYDWAIQNNGAPNSSSYCFRMTKSDGTAFTAYKNYPQLTTYVPPDFSQNYYRWYGNTDAVQPTDPMPAGSADLSQNDQFGADVVRDLSGRISNLLSSGSAKYVYATTYDSTNKVVYLAGIAGGFVKYNAATDEIIDLTSKTIAGWGSSQYIYALTFDSTNSVIYLGAASGKFGKYNPATDTFTDLTSKISSFLTGTVNGLTFDSTNTVIYLGGASGKFAKYTPSTDTAADLTAKISSFWSTNTVNALTYDLTNNVIYLGGALGKFGKYTPSTDTAVDLTAKISGFWSTNAVNALTYDSQNSVIYLGGNGGKFGKYVPSADTAPDLTAKISSFWSTNAINALTYDSTNNVVYLGGTSPAGRSQFAKYNLNNETATDLSSRIYSFWSTNTINALTYDSANKIVYLGGNTTTSASNFAKYLPAGQILPQNADILRLRMSAQIENTPVNSSAQAFKLQYGALTTTCSAIATWTDVGAAGSGVIWRGYNNATPADGTTVSANLLATSDVSGTYEEENNSAVNPNAALVGQDIEYDWVLQNNSAPNSSSYCFRMVRSDGAALLTYSDYPQLTTYVPYTLAQNNFRWHQNRDNVQPNDAYPSGSIDLGEYDSILAGDAAADLTAKISSAWSTNAVKALTYDSTNNVLYLVGVSGKVGKYNLATNTFTDLTYLFSGITSWTTYAVLAMTYDSTNNVVYLGNSNGKFAKYAPATGAAVDLTAKISAFWSTNYIYSMTYDSTNSVIYLGGYSTKFAKYVPSTDTATDLTAKLTALSGWATSYYNYSLTFDSTNSVIYIGGSSKFAKYTPSTDAAADLTSTISSFWLTGAINALTFDSTNSVIYLGGTYGGSRTEFAKYTPSTGLAADLTSKVYGSPVSWGNQPVLSLFFDSTYNVVYLGGGTAGTYLRFAKYTISTDTAASLSTALSSSSVWNATTYSVNALFFKSSIGFAYAGASSGKFAVYRAQQYPVTDTSLLRLRYGAEVGTTNLTASNVQLKMQYGVLSTTCSAIATWTDVGATGSGVIWRGYNNTTPADGAAISSRLLSTADVSGTYAEQNPSATNPNAALIGQEVEYDFVLQANSIASATNYCFRLTKSDGAALDTYTNYASLYTISGQAPNTPTLDLPLNTATLVSQTPALKTTATDPNSDNVIYKIELAVNNLFTSGLRIFNQELSQTGWTGQNAGTGTRYTSGTQGTYTISSSLTGCTDYYWRSFAKDPLGSGVWSATQDPVFSFTTLGTCNPPNAPTLDSPANAATGVSTIPVLQTTTTDPNSDDVQYKIQVALNSGFSSGLQTFDQSISQTGWTGQNAGTGTRYTSGTQGTYAVQTALTACTLYYWRSYAIDPLGSNGWSAVSSTRSFTVGGCNAAPNTPGLSSPANSATEVSLTAALAASTTDPDSDDVQYKIEIALNSGFSSGLQIFDQSSSQTGWSGQNSGGSTRYTSGTTGTYTISSALSGCTIYFWRAYAKDPLGTNTWSSASSENSFTSTGCNSAPAASVPSSITQSTDGLGRISFITSVSDPDLNDIKLKVEYSENDGGTWHAAQLASVSPSSGAVDLTNSNAYQIGTTDAIDTSTGIITLTVVWDTKSSSNGNGVLTGDQTDIKLRVTPNDNTADGTTQTTSAFEVDNLAPSGLTAPAFSNITTDQITASWSQATETNFQYYRLYYGTVQTDVQNQTSGYNQFTGIATVQDALTGLTSATTYYFKLAAYDNFGNYSSTSTANQATLTPSVVIPPPPPPPIETLRLGTPVIVSPANYETVFSSDLTIEGFVSEPNLLVIMTLDSISISQTTSNSSGRFYFYLFNLANAAHSARFQAKNTATAELSGPAYLTFTVEAPVPAEEEPEIYPQEEEIVASPRITSISQGQTLTENTFTLSGWAPANSTVIMLIDNLTLVQTIASGNGTFSFAFFNVSNGTHNLRLQARDAAGNVSDAYYFSFVVAAPSELVSETEETRVYPLPPTGEAGPPAEGIVELPPVGGGEIAPIVERRTIGDIAEQTARDFRQVVQTIIPIFTQTVPDAFRNMSLAVQTVIPKPHQKWEEQTPIEKTVNITTRTIAVGAVATGAVLTTGLATMSVGQLGFAFGDAYLLMARFLSTMLSLAGVRRRRPKPWGTVYDSQTKQPLDPAYVQLLDEKGNELETQITDLEGRFGFFVKQTGAYSLLANKTNYKFPSGRLSGKSSDELYDNLYFGTPIVLNEGQISNINLPMDAEKFDWNEFAKKEQGYIKINPKIEIWKRRSQNLIFWTGLISAPVSYLFSPSLFNLIILGFYFSFVLLRLAGVREKSFGAIYESATGQPLSFALISAYYPDVPVKVKSTVVDRMGRYYLLIPNGKYYITIGKKNPDGSYSPVHRSDPFEVKKGVVDKDIAI